VGGPAVRLYFGRVPNRRPDPAGAATFKVVIAGGGVAALEAALALDELAGDRVHLTLLGPAEDFVYRPMAVLEPFVRQPPRRLPLSKVATELGARLERDALAAVDTERRVVKTAGGQELSYDALLVAVGARTNSVLPGAIAIEPARMGESLGGLIEAIDDGSVRSVALVAPKLTWPLPVYEVALLIGEHARERNTDLALTIITAEPAPLAAFGPGVSDAVAKLLAEEGIELIAGTDAEHSSGRVLVSDGERELNFDRVVTVPRLTGPAIDGLPADPDGFLPVGSDCEVIGAPRVYGAGDATTFPVKFGGIAAQQADAAAASIAALAGAAAEPAAFDGVVHGILVGSRTPRRLYFTARFEDGKVIDSSVSDQPTWSTQAKVSARHLGPYLDERWAAGARWIAGQLSWEGVLARLEQRFGEKPDRAPVS
jgi:sulfide:quinone oxidoreductase